MLTAIRKSDKKKVNGEKIEKNPEDSYFCDYCQKPVIHHKADIQVVIGHFKHKPGASHCPNNTGESMLHYNMKHDISEYLALNYGNSLLELEVEKWLNNKQVRADVYIKTKKNTQIAIEVQASRLTAGEIYMRTKKYYDIGVYVLWILPYEYGKIYEYRFMGSNYSMDGNNWDYALREKIRFSEMETFLYWAYYKKLVYWDLAHEHSDSFICIRFGDFKTESVEFRKDGEDHYHEGRKTKTIKYASREWRNVKLERFKPYKVTTTFKVPMRNYEIPPRAIFSFDERIK